MSGMVVRKKKRDRLLEALSLRSSSRSPSSRSPTSRPSSSQPSSSQPSVSQPLATQPPATQVSMTTVLNVPAQPPAITSSSSTGQAAGGASAAKDAAFLENVVGRLTDEQRSTLNPIYAQSSGDISSAFTMALQAAENKKAYCISKQWTFAIGSRTISTRDKAEKVVELLDKVKRIGDIAAGADPIHFGLPWAGVSLILQVAVSEKQQMDAMLGGIATVLSIQRILDVYLAFFQTLPPGPTANILEAALSETYAIVLRFLATSIDLLSKGSMSRFWTALLGDEELQQFGSACLAARNQVEVAASNCDRSLSAHDRAITQECKGILDLLLGDLEAIKNQTARIELSISLAKLPRASTAAFDSTDEERMPRCLKSTRVELLSDIKKWVQDPGSAHFFWLQGVAGTGKSTIARTIANVFDEHQILGASFFFKRGHAERGSADLFFATIAIQLAQRIPGVDGAIAQLLSDEVGVYRKGIHAQFRDLILNPLQATSQSRQRTHLELVILIDALDECDNESDRKDDTKEILKCLAQLKGVYGLRLRLIVTSRLEPPVEDGFAALGSDTHDNILLHELPRSEIERDIRIFIKAEFEELRHSLFQRRCREVLHDGWPGDDIVQDLTKRSVPLFIFASTVCSFVADGRFTPQDQLKKVLDNRNPVQLSSTYLLVLQAMVPGSENGTEDDWDVDVMDNFRKIVGLIIFATEPPSITTIAMLLDLPVGQVEATLNSLHSVLDVTTDLDRPVRPFHLSFIEFLARPIPKSAHDFQIDERATHRLLAERCLAIMMQPGGLQQDICQVRKPGMRRLDVESHIIESHICPALSYACRYWVHHLQTPNVELDDQHRIFEFLSGWFLYWYEAMSWLGKASEVPRILRRLQALTMDDRSSRTVEALADAYQFARHNQYIADLAPLQLYSSALAFAPDISTTKTNFKSCMPSWLLHPPKMGGSWRTDVLKLEGHTDVITAIAFSPDGKLLGTCSQDGTARVWDTTDATCLLTDSHDRPNYYPNAVAFSSDSSKVTVAHVARAARISLRKTIEKPTIEVVVTVYDMQTRSLLRTMQCSGSSSNASRLVAPRLAVAFEGHDDDAIIAVVAHEGQVQAWRSVKDSNILTQEWTYHSSDPESPSIGFEISQDASLLCLAPGDLEGPSLAVLDPKTGVFISRHTCSQGQMFYNMKFSGRTLVCQIAAENWESISNVELRSSDVGNPDESTHLLECDGCWWSFSLANAGDRVAYNSGETHTVHIETIRAGKKVGKRFEVWHSRIVAVAPKGDLVADWHDGCLTVLDTQGLVTREFTPHVDDGNRFETPGSLVISPDCQYIASGHEKGITIWHIETGKRSHFSETMYRHQLAFSQDNRLMASKDFATLDVWDIRSGQMLLSMAVDGPGRPEFSEDGGDLFLGCRRVHIATATLTTRALEYPSLFGKDVGLSDYSREWVRFDDEDLLWVPGEYRSSESDARGCTVVLGQDDGSVMILTFDLSVL